MTYQSFLAKNKDSKAELIPIDIKTNLDPLLPAISVIPQDIGKVLLNLYSNAFYVVNERAKSTIQPADGGEIYLPSVGVSTRYEGNKILISVKDNGSGIPAPIIDKIFQPFFTTKPTGKGTGLGLSLSYDVIKSHGGELKVETEENVGTEFIIILPI
jgi:signal transduction histidine kinase